MTKDKIEIDGLRVIEEFLLTKGENIVRGGMTIPFKPLIQFGLIVYGMQCNATNKLAMKFDLERFFMRRCLSELSGTETRYIKVPKSIFDRVKEINDKYRNGENSAKVFSDEKQIVNLEKFYEIEKDQTSKQLDA